MTEKTSQVADLGGSVSPGASGKIDSAKVTCTLDQRIIGEESSMEKNSRYFRPQVFQDLRPILQSRGNVSRSPRSGELSPAHNMTQTRYEIVSTIGVGASSRVDKAHDPLIDRTVAMKTFGHGFGSEELQKQFMREAQILGRLSHPNIVSIYDLGTNENGSAYLVMEFVPGKTLESVMAAQGALPLARVGVWAGDLANALHRAHRASIVHGDVKPANIFVTDDGHIKLGDFGIARYATQLSGTGKLVGTPAYLSPEQIKGEVQDHRSDIFSLGIILYQMATGVRPFDGSSVTAVCAQIVAADPPPPSRHNPQLPKEFDPTVIRSLSNNPNPPYPPRQPPPPRPERP